MKMKKRLAALLMCLVMAFSLLPAEALAAGEHGISLSGDTLSATTPSPGCGSVTLSKSGAAAGETVTVSVEPTEEYLVSGVEASYTDGTLNLLAVAFDKASGLWSFTMPDFDVEVSVVFQRAVLDVMTLGGEDAAVTLGYDSSPVLTVTGAPEGASYTWYEGEDALNKEAEIEGASAESYAVPVGLSAGDHKYTAAVSAEGYAGATRTFTLRVSYPRAQAEDNGSGGYDLSVPGTEIAGSGGFADGAHTELTLSLSVASGGDEHSVKAGASGSGGNRILAELELLASGSYTGADFDDAADIFLAAEALAEAMISADGGDFRGNSTPLSHRIVLEQQAAAIPGAAVSRLAALSAGCPGAESVVAIQSLNASAALDLSSVTGVGDVSFSADFSHGAEDIAASVEELGIDPSGISGFVSISLTDGSGSPVTGSVNVRLAAPEDIPEDSQTGLANTGVYIVPATGGCVYVSGSESSFDREMSPAREEGGAQDGWRQSADGRRQMYYRDGEALKGWQTNIPGEGGWFYFAPDTGYMATGWLTVGGARYYLGSDGEMLTGWQRNIDGVVDWRYFDAGTGEMLTGWHSGLPGWGSSRFYFDADGILYRDGAYTIDGSRYTFSGGGVCLDAQPMRLMGAAFDPAISAAISIEGEAAVFVAANRWELAADTDWYAGHESEESYAISTPGELAGLAELVNGGESFSGKTISIEEDIDLSGAFWTPIGEESRCFSGTFDGGGRTVSGLSVYAVEPGWYGLFGTVSDAFISGLTVTGGVEVELPAANPKSESVRPLALNVVCAGGVAGFTQGGEIKNCASAVELSISAPGKYVYAGGVTGRMETGEQSGCSNSGALSASGGRVFLGGVVGKAFNGDIYNCVNTGSLYAAGTERTAAGGLAGELESYSRLMNGYSRSTMEENAFHGVFAGSTASAVDNCYYVSEDGARCEYWSGGSNDTTKTPADIKGLADELNRWVQAENAAAGEAKFSSWYASEAYNGGYPCFTRYVPPACAYYVIAASAGEGGTVSPSGRVTVLEGLSGKFTFAPAEGYKIYDVLADGESKGAAEGYTFENVRGDHSLSVLFAREFSDVDGQWFAPHVDFASAMGLMEGVGGGRFGPYLGADRGMLAAILWRMEGSPKAEGNMTFTDVPGDSFCHAAVAWAAELGIVLGYSAEEYRPEQVITRQELAAMLCRYAEWKGLAVSAPAELSRYGDAGSISGYARPAMAWACGAGLMEGDGENLAPLRLASRAEAAAILHRLCALAAPKSA